jgi:ABC-2 type transport system ATP-binding protein
VVIDKGRIVCEGTPAEVKSLGSAVPGGLQSRNIKIIRCTTAIAVNALLNMPGVTSATLNGEITTIMTSQAESTLRELLALDQVLHSIEVQSPKLEDAFLALTGDHK